MIIIKLIPTKLLLKLLIFPALVASLNLITVVRAEAQAFTNLYNFTALTSLTNSDGANSTAGLVLAGDTLYGTSQYGGSMGRGSIFAIKTDGTGFTNLYSFINTADGANPAASLVLSGGRMYGTTQNSGSLGGGTLFKISTNGTGFSVVYSFPSGFTNGAGTGPYAPLIVSGDRLYGTAFGGGAFGYGTVFGVSTNGTGFTNLHSFNSTNGANPTAGLVLGGDTLYGTAYQGGVASGTVFAVKTNGTGFMNLHDFVGINGANPYAGLILSGNTLYGTTRYGGDANAGTLFAINTNGTGFTSLHVFGGLDGANPNATLSLAGNTLFGTAYRGGVAGKGTVFSVNINGGAFTNHYSFTTTAASPPFNNADGANPVCAPVKSGNTLYGTTSAGGNSGNGTIFSLAVPAVPPQPPQLAINLVGANVVLTWPTNAGEFILQSTTNLVSPIVWGTVSPTPVVVTGENTVTNPTSGTQQFYRLSQ